MSNWKIVLPSALQNLVSNPSVERNTTGYSAKSGGTLSRVATQQRFGAWSIQYTPTSSVNDGMYYATASLTSGRTYTFSIYVKGVNGIPYRIYFADTSGNMLGTAKQFTGNGVWQRIEVAYTETATNSRRVYVEKDNSASVGAFYGDGLQVEEAAAATDYCDGDQPGCSWIGAWHASNSLRSAQSRATGTPTDFDTLGPQLEGASGIGMPPMNNVFQEYGLVDGGFFQRSVARLRAFILALNFGGATTNNLHALRKAVLDALKIDRVEPQQPTVIQYAGAGKNLRVAGVYDDGLQYQEVRSSIEMRVPLRFIAGDPFWYEDIEEGVRLTALSTLTNAGMIYQNDAGDWVAWGPGARWWTPWRSSIRTRRPLRSCPPPA